MNKTLFDKAKQLFPNVPDDKILEGYNLVKERLPDITDEQLLNMEEELKQVLQTSFLARMIVLEKKKV